MSSPDLDRVRSADRRHEGGLLNADAGARPAVVVAGDDLFFSARIASALDALGYRPIVVSAREAFRERLTDAPQAAILDLASRRLDAIAAIREAKADPSSSRVPLLGFCGHRDTARQAAAREAGCDLVTTNGAVSGGLETLLATLLGATRHGGRSPASGPRGRSDV